MKEKLQFIVISFFMCLATSIMTVCATSYQYDSSDVLYDNTGSGLESTDVQGAVGELYRTATDYSSLDGRVTNLEGYFQNNPSSYFNGSSLELGKNTTAGTASLGLYKNGIRQGALWSNSSNDGISIESYKTDGTTKGALNLNGNPVKINGVDVSSKIVANNFFKQVMASSGSVNTLTINYPYASFRYFAGIMFTRYATYAIMINYGSNANALTVQLTKIGTNGTNTEDFTTTVDESNVILKSSMGWNRWTIFGIDSVRPSDIELSVSST